MFRMWLVFVCCSTFAAAPERVISLAPSLTSAVLELDAAATLVGVTDYCALPDDATHVRRIGGYQDPNVELIVVLKPDLVIALPEHLGTIQKLKQLGLATLTLANTTIADINATMETLGETLARRSQVTAWQTKVDGVVEALTPLKARPSVLLVVSHEAKQQTINQVYVAGPASFLNELLVLAGGSNAIRLKQPVYPKLTREALLSVSPDRVINLVPHATLDAQMRNNQMQAWLNIPHFSAAKPEAILFLTHEAVLQAGPRYYEILRDMRTLLEEQ